MEKPQNYALFSGKKILAPMVRAGRTPLRTLALNYGADLVYTEEIVDQKLLEAQRIENAHIGTIDFIKGNELVLRIGAEEKSKCILQIGTSSAENAAKICKKFGAEVAGIDLNMGCPKPFSVHAGMGAALLSDPLKAKEILTAMVSASPIPVSCKIRVLDDKDKTMEFVRIVEQCGISAIAIHGRRRAERPSDECRVEEICQICDAFKQIPVIANGGSQQIKSNADIEEFRLRTGASSVMFARKAFTNPSIFRTEGGILPMDEEIVNFLKKACQYDEQFSGVKYVVQRMLGSQQQFDQRGRATVMAGTMRQICRIWGVESTYLEWRRKLNGIEEEGNGPVKRPKIANDDGQMNDRKPQQNSRITFTLVDGFFTTDLSFPMKNLKNGLRGLATPKCVLRKYCREQRWLAPIYETTQRPGDCRFTAKVCINSKQFCSTISQPNTRMAEQVAALVALHGLGIRHRLEGEWEERE